MKIQDLLPIGSVVLLKNGEKKLMIIGVMQKDGRRKKKNYDYLGELYPEGHLGDGVHQYLFNHEDIDKIIFRGYDDDERKEFLEKLSEEYGD